jgi:cell division protein FtsB
MQLIYDRDPICGNLGYVHDKARSRLDLVKIKECNFFLVESGVDRGSGL